jgi:D-serine deaminase-like pyridoxal phosphate-dependent protein
MKIENLKTPTILLNIEALENNIKKYQKMCDDNKKELWPMIKTHKSKKLMEMQIKAGATGALCGTLDEAEMCCDLGIKIMYAYPVASKENIERVIELTKKCDFIL